MSSYIDTDELIFFGLGDPDDENFFEFVPKEFIDKAPTIDVVEVVRCKDCTRQMICFHNDDWFCADRERIEDAEIH